MKSHGYTIVELVIVLAVAAILTTFGIVASSQVQKDSRDKKRESDNILFRNELEKFYDKNGEYPPGCSNNCSSWFFTNNTSTGGTILSSTSTNATIKAILPGITSNFYGPQNTSPDTPLASSSILTDRYFYFGGTVNNSASTSSAISNQTSTPKVCIMTSSLTPGQVGSYVVGYYSEVEDRWILTQGQQGVKATLSTSSDPSCKFE